jgi:hypothetical protein
MNPSHNASRRQLQLLTGLLAVLAFQKVYGKNPKMNAFNKEYFFIDMSDDERLPYLTPDEDTVNKPYGWEVLPTGSKPLIFHNGSLDWQEERRIRPIDPPPDIMFNGSYPVVCERIANKLWDLDPPIPNMAIQPAIYIDHKDKWHENYWFLTFTNVFDCWDRERSSYSSHVLKDPPRYEIFSYSLDESLMEKTPFNERRLFKMGGTTTGMIVVHESLADLFRVKGVNLTRIDEW